MYYADIYINTANELMNGKQSTSGSAGGNIGRSDASNPMKQEQAS